MEFVKNAKSNKEDIKNFCYDCKEDIEVENNSIKNGVFLIYDDCGEKIKVMKCKNCYDKNKALGNFKKCEVYSRVVGYLRPVEQWNTGKKQEFGERKEFGFSS